MAKFNFTKKTLDNLDYPAKGKRGYHYDTNVRGLGVSVTHNGTVSFILYRKVGGRPERIFIGHYPDMAISRARGKASELNAIIADGENPQDHRRGTRAELTLGQLFEDYLERHAKPYKRSWRDDFGRFNNHLSRWKNRKLSQIRKRDIQALHAKLGKSGHPYGANRLLALLNVMFNKANEWGYFDGPNPAHAVKKFPEKSRERFLQADELPRFFEALAEEPNETIRDFIHISLLTGARRGNVLAMRWDEINLDNCTWRIPMTKAGREHTVPLMPEAVVILNERKINSESPFVFPGDGKSGHLNEPKRAWKRILERAKIKDLRIHDLRRTLGSWQAATGASLSIIGKSLDHSNVSTTAIYARLNIDPVRRAMETATSAMLAAAKVKPTGEVLPISKK